MELEVSSSCEDHQSDEVRVDLGEDLEVLPAEILLPLELSLVHVLNETSLGPAVHLHELMFAGHHVVVVAVKLGGIFLYEGLTVVHISLHRQLLKS